MHALGGGGHGGLWGWNLPPRNRERYNSKRQRRRRPDSKSSDSVEPSGGSGNRFPFKQAVTAGALALTGDTIAQLKEKGKQSRFIVIHSQYESYSQLSAVAEFHTTKKITRESHTLMEFSLSLKKHACLDVMKALLSDHDWIRALRMASYGFLLYGPGSYAWYQYLDRYLPKPTVRNLMLKVLLNQIVLGPCVIAVVFAWNNLWQRKLAQLPDKYKKDALPTLLYGFRFWIPVSVLNFWVVPLQARVAFMSMGSIFWNFYLSSTMSKFEEHVVIGNDDYVL
ncbi:hypothetical protein TIFTF001_036825 [Ficus carica]|uniref:Uncharacterized protein n=1 Tax=Ficus carica TaxID=3494 RepID=A0AA88E450_FICCA|nr:hypothetical protein TIFTF001_036810 [Ficus carica]GMN67772.1 hypothetical protein TIFTF001_036825 [Ficus carica]